MLGLALIVPIHRSIASTGDVSGKWQFVVTTPGGDLQANAEFKLDGKKVSGTFDSTPVDGTFADGKLDLSFAYDAESKGAGKGTMKINGDLSGDELSGKWEFGEYSGTFKATRPK
jgi:hypothetical protein